jgi:tRNA nucleotidyltransferase (CCA-adding enzyme)
MDQNKVTAILDHCVNDDLIKLRSLFQAKGFDIRIVGGAVRDILCGQTPDDIDLCTDAFPDEAIAIYEAAGIRYIPTGIDHGTISVVMSGETYEITSLRFDMETDGRHAVVKFTRQWQEDLARRDLTINAMSMTFDGVLDDPFGGRQDLRSEHIRFVGDPAQRIREDYLRILRYFRFAGRYGCGFFDHSQLNAIHDNASGLGKVSRERVWQEVRKIMAHPSAASIYEQMSNTDILQYADLPAFDAIKKQRIKSANVFATGAVGVFALLFYSASDAVSYAKKLKLSTDDTKLISFVAKVVNTGHTDLLSAMKYEMLINNQPLTYTLTAMQAMGEFDIACSLRSWPVPLFPVTGDDLLNAGMKPGRQIGQALTLAKQNWFMSDCMLSKNDLMQIALKTER